MKAKTHQQKPVKQKDLDLKPVTAGINERKTEYLTEKALENVGFLVADFQFQGAEESEIQRLLPSKKNGSAGSGKPEFIIRLNGDAADILVVECKLQKTKHASETSLNEDSKLKAPDFAEDGVIHYMKGLRKEFNVIGLAISGDKEPLQITTFMAVRGGPIQRLKNKSILPRLDYLTLLRNSSGYGQKTELEILSFARSLHNYLRDEMELSDSHKPLIVSGILLALRQPAFEQGYRNFNDKNRLANALYSSIRDTLEDALIDEKKRAAMMSNYDFIKTHQRVKEHLRETVARIYRNLFFAMQPHSSLDFLGSFYGEFLRYSGGDQKGLGIVLTPRHITELFSDLANLDPEKSVVLDICAGSGGFLIAAMSHMITAAVGESKKIKRVKEKGLIGIELAPHMFTLACANMILRGDGKANMFMDDSLKPSSSEVLERLEKLKPNVAFLNPPYSKKDKSKDELRFVLRSLDLLDKSGGTGISIIPVGRLIDDGPDTIQVKKEILERHTLTHVMSMPPQLFPKVGTVTAIAVFKAHQSHWRTIKEQVLDEQGAPVLNENGKLIFVDVEIPRQKTWFGYWRDDGFMMKKNSRVERSLGLWQQTKQKWLSDYWNGVEKQGYSCNRAVTHEDEWVAEAYLETDYSQLAESDFEKDVKKFLLYKLMVDIHSDVDEDEEK